MKPRALPQHPADRADAFGKRCTVTRMGSDFDTDGREPHSIDALYQLHVTANELFGKGRWEDAVAICDEAIDRYGREQSLDVMLRVADLMLVKCCSLASSPRPERLVEAVDALPVQFGDSTDPKFRSHVASALRSTADWLLLIGSVDLAIVVTDELLTRFEREGNPVALASTGRSLVTSASALSWDVGLGTSAARTRLGKLAILADGLWAAGKPSVRRTAREPGRASLLFRASRHRLDLRRVRLEQAVKLDDLVIERLRYAADPALRRIAIEAKVNRGASLFLLGRFKRSFADWGELVPMNDPASAEAGSETNARGDQEYVEQLVTAKLWQRTGAKEHSSRDRRSRP
jgi:hypothetical protein